MPKVFIVNEGMHDYTAAEAFGKLITLTSGPRSRVNISQIVRDMAEPLAQSAPNDYILVSGPPTLNIVACVLFAMQHKRLNLLIHISKDNVYVARNITLHKECT